MTFLNAMNNSGDEILALEVRRFHLQHCYGGGIAKGNVTSAPKQRRSPVSDSCSPKAPIRSAPD